MSLTIVLKLIILHLCYIQQASYYLAETKRGGLNNSENSKEIVKKSEKELQGKKKICFPV